MAGVQLSKKYIAKTAAYTMVNGDAIAASTTGGAFTLTLPATPADGWNVTIVDTDGTFASNNCSVAGNGKNIQGISQTLALNIKYASVGLTFSSAENSWLLV